MWEVTRPTPAPLRKELWKMQTPLGACLIVVHDTGFVEAHTLSGQGVAISPDREEAGTTPGLRESKNWPVWQEIIGRLRASKLIATRGESTYRDQESPLYALFACVQGMWRYEGLIHKEEALMRHKTLIVAENGEGTAFSVELPSVPDQTTPRDLLKEARVRDETAFDYLDEGQ